MSKKAMIASFGLNENFLRGKTQEQMADLVLEKIETVRGYHPDLIALPEAFLKTGGDITNPRWEEITSQLLENLKRKAAELQTYIAASVYESAGPSYPGYKYNSVILIDRTGKELGRYRKIHPVVSEMEEGKVIPGKELPVFDTDFGRIGFLICFDICWREEWQRLADKGAQLVVWSSAYDGGNLLQAYAIHHMYYIASSVRTNHARIIDPAGHPIAEGSRWNGLALGTIDLDTEVFHIDGQFDKIDLIRKDLGDKVTIRSYSEENLFTIETNDPEWPVEKVKQNYQLLSYKEYREQATKVQDAWRSRFS